MKELIEILNEISIGRLILYSCILIVSIGIIFDGIESIVKILKK